MIEQLFRKDFGRFFVAGFKSATLKTFGVSIGYASRTLTLDIGVGAQVISLGVRF